ncbi:MAG: sigma-70 family RNA polymerase sigma factor [Clostridia bacterium]|nr:sigma-70 family RNA polymerase sigma factor [Clostridia bacterium]
MMNDSYENMADELITLGMTKGNLAVREILRLGSFSDMDEETFKSFLRQLWSLNIEVIPPQWEIADPDSAKKAAKRIRNSSEEEKAAQTGSEDAIALYLTELSAMRPLNAGEDRELIYAVEQLQTCGKSQGADEAISELIEGSLYLSAVIASDYTGKGVLYLDLVQEGNIAVMELAGEFDYFDNISFTAMAAYRIDSLMRELTQSENDTVNVPQELAEDMAKLKKYYDSIRSDEGREPNIKELAEKLNISAERVEKIIAASKGRENTAAVKSDTDISKTAPGEDAKTEQDKAEEQLSRQVADMLAALPELEAKVISLRYGLGGKKEMTAEEIAAALDISIEEVENAELEAMKRLGR